MFRHVVRRDAESLRNLANIERFVDQHAHDPNPGVLAEGPECHDAVLSLNNGKCAVTGGKTIKPNDLIGFAGLGHGGAKTKWHKPSSEASRATWIARSMRAA